MNNRIKELTKQAGFIHFSPDEDSDTPIDWSCDYTTELEKFAELIVEECYQHCKDQLMDKKLAEEAGLDYNDGVMDCAIGLKQHFGVTE